jgi:formamidopyrimidine-DNA glycosylase
MSPELPEVETFKRYVDSYTLNQQIKQVIVRDRRILMVAEKEFKKSLLGKRFLSTKRHGKYLFIKVNSLFLILHFGMSGEVVYYDGLEEEPLHSRILFEFTNGNFLSYISQRMFGRGDLTKNIEDYISKKKLGPDAYDMDFEEFKRSLYKRTALAKSALMNQEIIAGIGNIYSDEILFQAKIHPKTKINKISDTKLRELFEIIKSILKVGIEKKGELTTYPDDFLIPHRKKEDKCPHCGVPIERYEISQRHGFFCPNCQILNKNEDEE